MGIGLTAYSDHNCTATISPEMGFFGPSVAPISPTITQLNTPPLMFEVSKDILLKLMGALLPTLLGLFYKAQWISDRVKVRIGSEGDGITVQGGELPYLRIWMQVTNLSPFTVELDRVVIQALVSGGTMGEFLHVRKHLVKPASEQQFLIEAALNEFQIKSLKRLQAKQEATLYLTAFINCKVHNFELTRNVQTSNVRYINLDL